jgi:guanosine-3',5'-bis(diphosphate) 3'-pyrophosphohydrolase
VNLRNAGGMLFQMPGRLGRAEAEKAEADKAEAARPEGERALPIRGVGGDLPVRFAPEGAVPGDRIVGILHPGSGITIYPIQSPSLTAFDDQPERWIDVRWDIDEGAKRALSGARHFGERPQRARFARPHRAGDRRQRRATFTNCR